MERKEVYEMISGTKFICNMPEWADGDTELALFEGMILITHPEHPPHVFNKEKGIWEELGFYD